MTVRPRLTALGGASIVALVLALPRGVSAQSGRAAGQTATRYTLTVFVDEGDPSHPTELDAVRRRSSSSSDPNFGHVFIDLANGDKHVVIGYYGARRNPRRGQTRPDADLIRNNGWHVKKPYTLTEAGYQAARRVVREWGTERRGWGPCHHCGDFAEAVARAAGVPLGELPRTNLGINMPRLWGKYLREHGGIVNPERKPAVLQARNPGVSQPKLGTTGLGPSQAQPQGPAIARTETPRPPQTTRSINGTWSNTSRTPLWYQSHVSSPG